MTIVPDTKDWTWVLERPCPECRFDAAAVQSDDVAERVRANAGAWQDVLTEDDDAVNRVRVRPAPQVWSALEYACHVLDVLRLYDVRLRLMLDEVDPLYDNWDQDAAAIAGRYAEQDPRRVAGEVTGAAATIADRFEVLTPEQWLRSGRRSDGARFTVTSFAQYFLHDLVHHLHDVRSSEPAGEQEAS